MLNDKIITVKTKEKGKVEEMKAKRAKKKMNKIFSLYNLAILVCIVLIGGAIYIIFKPEQGENIKKKSDKVEIVNAGENTSEQEAKKTAVKQFKELGEKVKEDELEIMKIQRQGEEYYYVTSKENTLEIKISTGKVTRVNSVTVE